jgi:rhodanese-related sulfurtransferase
MKKILKLPLFLFLTVSIIACSNKQPSKTITKNGEINVISPADFKEKSVNYTVVDVRTPQEFQSGHIEGAININYFDKNFLEQITKFNTDEPIFIYCKSGNRSGSASKKISNLGFKEVYDLQNGIIFWNKNNYKIVK